LDLRILFFWLASVASVAGFIMAAVIFSRILNQVIERENEDSEFRKLGWSSFKNHRLLVRHEELFPKSRLRLFLMLSGNGAVACGFVASLLVQEILRRSP